MGRKKLKPDDLIKYEGERKNRMEQRKQIVEELENKELTFKPQLVEKSVKLQVRKSFFSFCSLILFFCFSLFRIN
jgi:hypothetical protein